MIVSVHIADVGSRNAMLALARPPRTREVAGLRYAATTIAVPLSARLLPMPAPGRLCLVAAWDDDEQIDRFLSTDPFAVPLAQGFQARMRAVHVFGAFSPLSGVLGDEPAMDDKEPAAALTIGRLRLTQTLRFLRASARAEELANRSPALIAASGLTRPPRLVATFSLWRSKAAMREYAGGHDGPGHVMAARAHASKSFHHEAAFIRLRPYHVAGTWNGHEPLSAASLVAAAATGA